MREFIINTNDANQRVDKYLSKAFKKLPQNLMYKYIRNKKIKVNRSRCEISQRLNVGDTLQLYIAEEFFDEPSNYDFLQSSGELNILFENEHLLVVNKEVGLLVHSDETVFQDTLIGRILKYLYMNKAYEPQNEMTFTPALANRIDRNTQGIVIAAKSAEGLRSINQLIKERKIEKHYCCIVEGQMSKKQEHLIHYYKKNEALNQAMINDHEFEGSTPVELTYQVMDEKKNYSLLDIHLITGKSHQIRAQLAHIQHPLYGDVKYHAKKTKRNTQALWSVSITFNGIDENNVLYDLKGKKIQINEKTYVDEFKSLL